MAGQNPSAMAYPTLDDFARNQVGVAGKVELIWQPLFDYNVYPTAGVGQLLFFAAPQGQGFSSQPIAAAAPKSAADTNMVLAGMLPAPQAFWLDGIEVVIEPGGSATANLYANAESTVFLAAAAAAATTIINDFNIIAKSGRLDLNIMQKNYYSESPLYRFPQRAFSRADMFAQTTSATTGAVISMFPRCEGTGVRLDPGLGLATTTNFGVTLTWPTVVPTTAPGSGFNARIGVFLNGWLFRAAQ